MSYYDKTFGSLLPTRNGEATGSANERQMLDKIGGSTGYRKSFRINPDGSTTMLTTKNGSPQFTNLDLGLSDIGDAVDSCTIEAFHGLIEMGSIDDTSAESLRPAKIYATNFVSQVNGDGVVGIGKVDANTLRGTRQIDGTELTQVAGSGIKKLFLQVPPSMFTGRMRLYVQALYGGNWDQLELSRAESVRPALRVNTVDRSSSYPGALINTGCGIYMNPLNGIHFLITPIEDKVIVTPLRATPCAEKMRPFITSVSTKLSDKQKERIETYILSRSVPYMELSSVFGIPKTPTEAMGYSWHFNWAGDRCDIVDVEEVFIGDVGLNGFRSTHYRLIFTSDGLNLSVSRVVVDGPSVWSVPKHKNVMAYPDWSSDLIKAGNTPSGLHGSGGALYAFYERDTLQTLRARVVKTATVDAKRESSPIYYAGNVYGGVTNYYLDTGVSGEVTETDAANNASGAYFMCGGTTIGGPDNIETGFTQTEKWLGFFQQHTIHPGGYTSGIDPVSYNKPSMLSSPYSVSGTYPYINVSYTTYSNFPAYSSWYKTAGLYHRINYSFNRSKIIHTLCVIPYMDAEAVYMISQETISEKRTGNEDTTNAWPMDEIAGRQENKITSGVDRDFIRILQPDPRHANYVDQVNESISLVKKVLVSSSGSFIAGEAPKAGLFWSNSESVNAFYATRTSINGAVYSKETGISEGSSFFPEYFSFVGWA